MIIKYTRRYNQKQCNSKNRILKTVHITQQKIRKRKKEIKIKENEQETKNTVENLNSNIPMIKCKYLNALPKRWTTGEKTNNHDPNSTISLQI